MSKTGIHQLVILGFIALLAFGSAAAQTIDVPGVGADGELNLANCTGDHVINLDQAIDGTWNDPGTRPLRDTERPLWGGVGVYDKDKWAVVYDYTSISIPAGCRVVFENHKANPPVVWLVQGDVSIDGEVNLNGDDSQGDVAVVLTKPGPGGFRGARTNYGSTIGGAGLGPGGGAYNWGGGNYAGNASGPTPGVVYGNARVIPLIGGSGGGTRDGGNRGGGAGGGAILIAADQRVEVGSSGKLTARGGRGDRKDRDTGHGAGGAIRILAYEIDCAGDIWAHKVNESGSGASAGGDGRVRFEAFSILDNGSVTPDYTYQLLSENERAVLWLEDLPAEDPKPRAWVAEIAGQDATTKDPVASFGPGQADLNVANPTSDPILIVIKTEDVPTPAEAGPWNVLLRATTPTGGAHQEVQASFISTDGATGISTWHAEIVLKNGTSALQVRAYKP